MQSQPPPSPLVDISLLKPGQNKSINSDNEVPQYMRQTASSRKRRFDSPLTHSRPIEEVFPTGKEPSARPKSSLSNSPPKISPTSSPRSSRLASPTRSTSLSINLNASINANSKTSTALDNSTAVLQPERSSTPPKKSLSRPTSASQYKNSQNTRLSSNFASNVQRFTQKTSTTPSPNQYALPTLDELDKILSKQRNMPTSSFRNSGHKIDDVLNLKHSKLDTPSPHTYISTPTTNKKAPSPSASFRSSTSRITPINSKKVDFRVEFHPTRK